jgi:hypothetical protein
MKYLLFLFLLTVPCLAQERYVIPVDEGVYDPSFLAFRKQLIKAVKNRDLEFLLSVTDREFSGSFGPDEGVEFFKKKLENPSSKPDLWRELLVVLEHGGTFGSDRMTEFYAPYLFGKFPDDLESYKFQAIFGSNVNLRSVPGLEAPVTTRLSYNIVQVDYEQSLRVSPDSPEYDWIMIETLGGMKGYVKAEFVRSPIDYRAGFHKVDGKWKLRWFLAGD